MRIVYKPSRGILKPKYGRVQTKRLSGGYAPLLLNQREAPANIVGTMAGNGLQQEAQRIIQKKPEMENLMASLGKVKVSVAKRKPISFG